MSKVDMFGRINGVDEHTLAASDGPWVNAYELPSADSDIARAYRASPHMAALRASRDAWYGVELQAEAAINNSRNRASAVKIATYTEVHEGKPVLISRYFAQCACGFIGLHTPDRGLALQHYDEHGCAFEKQKTGKWGQVKGVEPAVIAPTVEAEHALVDDAVARMQLLELK